MSKFLIAVILVGALLAGGLVALLRSRRDGMPSQDVLDRAAQREREQAARDRADGRD